MKKNLLNLFVLCFLTLMSVNAQTENIQLVESTYVQGGETALEVFGVTKPNTLLVFNSKTNTKYSRITFMKFKLPEGIEKVKSAHFNIQIKVFKDKTFPDSKFDLAVQAVPNSKWSSQSMTFNNAPLLEQVLGSAKVNQTLDDKLEWIKVDLDAEALNELIKNSRKRMITLALANNISAKTSAIVGNGSFLSVEKDSD